MKLGSFLLFFISFSLSLFFFTGCGNQGHMAKASYPGSSKDAKKNKNKKLKMNTKKKKSFEKTQKKYHPRNVFE
ncbi:MAG: hypothetical protein ACK4ND_01100 [Cytophagaceae bacterium]